MGPPSLDLLDFVERDRLVGALVGKSISEGQGIDSWKLEPSGHFSTGSLYIEISNNFGVCDTLDI